ncbi:TM2 domain-containing protein [Longirhabdus pacifica]|uniref:TM2 domain-containing protein n=1 Tax=Longirhabdus pacifica TaxID=2305227 RepID=UPI001008AE3E|nr:TM2 domain-containing protein [Longirhabdus pacifica]
MDNLLSKHDLTTQQLQMLSGEFEKRKKSTGTTWILWLFLGGIGGHRYYLGNIPQAIIMTLTLGFLGFWTLIDAFMISGAIRKANEKIESEIIQNIQVMNSAKQNDANVPAM